MVDIKTEISVTKRMYGWSKWGGAYRGLVQDESDEWVCQACGKPQVKDLPVYFIPEDEREREYFKVCAQCKHESMIHHVTIMADLIQKIRRPHGILDILRVANLSSLPRMI